MSATATATRPERSGRVAVATYNVHRCIGGDGRYSLERVVRALEQLDADVLCLQEVSCRDGDGHDQPRILARALGFEVCAGLCFRTARGDVGNALLTRLPIAAVERLDLSVRRGSEPRGAVVARLDWRGSELVVVNTHFGLQRRERARQLERLLAAVGAPRPTVLAGDLNEWRRGGPCGRRLAAAFGPAPMPRTFPARRPVLPLDRVYAGRGAALHSAEAIATAVTRWASDHLPVRALVEVAATGADQYDTCASRAPDSERTTSKRDIHGMQ